MEILNKNGTLDIEKSTELLQIQKFSTENVVS